MDFAIINDAGDSLFTFTVACADARWIAVNEAHLNGMIKLFRGTDLLFKPRSQKTH